MDFVNFSMLSFFLFFVGLAGIFLNRKNVLLVLMSIELVLLAVNFNFLVSSSYVDDRFGQIFALFILTVAAAESSIGLAILVFYYRLKRTIALEHVNLLKR